MGGGTPQIRNHGLVGGVGGGGGSGEALLVPLAVDGLVVLLGFRRVGGRTFMTRSSICSPPGISLI